jgi:antitoxin component YwqK of YwqJK toxin-antitoxin module
VGKKKLFKLITNNYINYLSDFGGLVSQFSNGSKKSVYYIFLVIEFTYLLLFVVAFLNTKFKSHKTNNIFIKDGLIYHGNESTPYTGNILDTLENKVIIEYSVVNGIKEGGFFISTLAGVFTVYGHINDNKNVGRWEYYYDSGQLQCTGNYYNDLPTGKWKWYYKNGLEKSEGIFVKGKKEGKWTEYDEEGNPIKIINYYNGEMLSMVEIENPKMI